MDYFTPETLEKAYEYLASESGAVIIAGGTDLAAEAVDSPSRPGTLVDITRISGLSGITSVDGGLLIGACTSIADVAASKTLPAALRQGAAAIGSPQIRNAATIGGNICNASPCGDTLSPLLAFSAVFILESAGGKRRVDAEDFFKGPKNTVLEAGEILTGVFIDARHLEGSSAFKMYGKRNGQVISQVNGAVWIRMDGDRVEDIQISFGSVAPVPVRARESEGRLRGKTLTEDMIAAGKAGARAEVAPISDVRATEDYRFELTEAIFYEILCDAAGFNGGGE